MTDDVDFRLLTQNSVDMVCFVGLDLVMSYASPSCSQILGWSPEEMCGKGPDVFVLQEDLPIVAAAQEKLMINGVDHEPTTVRMWKKDGSFAWMEIYARVVKDESMGEVKGIVLTMRDITVRKHREDSLESLAQIDGLTGLANRRMFDLGLDREWKRSFREETNLSLLLIDVDYFKNLNDRYGHRFGDECLKAVAAEIRRIVHRASDVLARYGGEEIGVILPGTGLQGAQQLAEAIRNGIEQMRIRHDGQPDGVLRITVSIGVGTVFARHCRIMNMPEALLEIVDEALYMAKQRGRNCVVTGYLAESPKDGVP